MRKEAERWWQQALKDLQSAEKNLEVEEYYLAAEPEGMSLRKAISTYY